MANQQSQATVDNYARALASKMEAYVQKRYNVPDFKLKVIISFGERRKVSRGGTKGGLPFINIVGKRYAEALESNKMTYLNEYAHIRNDPVIGQILNTTWQTALAGIVAHEVAHAVQFFPTTKESAMGVYGVENLNSNDKALAKHNWFWQRIYADLRTEFVNTENSIEETPVVTAAPQKAATQRTVNKKWKVVSQQKGKARFSYYYTASDELIGILCVAPGGYFRYYPETETFKHLTVKNFNEARKIEFGI
jgi:hypothetical protein